MQSELSSRVLAPDAPRSGAPAPLLDIKDGNVAPRGVQAAWTRKQRAIRRTVLDRLTFWVVRGYRVLWVTLTSAPGSSAKRLRTHFQSLRDRIGHTFGYHDFEYVCVDTREGHGVLHMLWAWKGNEFFVPFRWLQETWKQLHGALFVNVQAVGQTTDDGRRLSRYIVAQYCGGQSGLVRLSQSRCPLPLTRMRKAWFHALHGLQERYEWGHDNLPRMEGDPQEEFRRAFWSVYRSGWLDLLDRGSTVAHGVQFAWWDSALHRVGPRYLEYNEAATAGALQ